jgi:hypothetical protein
MRRTDLDVFIGGIRETVAPGDFSENQWAQLKGFIITDESRIRSQFPIQQIGTASNFVDLTTLSGKGTNRYLVGLKSDGTFWSCTITSLTAASNATTTKGLTWTQLTKSGGGALTITGNPRFLCHVPYITASDGLRTGVLVHQVARSSGNGQPAIIIYENSSATGLEVKVYEDGSGNALVYPGYLPSAPSNVQEVFAGGNTTVSWTPEAPGSSAITGWTIYYPNGTVATTAAAGATSAVVTGTSGGGIGFVVRASNSYGTTPFDAAGGVQVPSKGYVPRANVGVFWNGQLVLGDIEYYKSYSDLAPLQPLTNTNATRQSNGIWFSNPGQPDTFDPLGMFTVGSADAVITGMVVVPQGLIILTTSPTDGDGVILLRGNSVGVVNDRDVDLNFSVEVIRGHFGGIDRPNGYGDAISLWPSIGNAVFINENGGIWHTNVEDVVQLDAFGAAIPSRASVLDNLASVDRFLFVGRDNRLLVMREFSSNGAWTEMVYPGTVTPACLTTLEGSVYFISNHGVAGATGGLVNRIVANYNVESASDSERGMIDGVLVDLTISTRTLGDPKRFEKSMWHRFGLRARGIRGAVLKSFTVAAGSLLKGSFAPLATTYSPAKNIGDRFEVVVPAHGPSIEAYATIVMQGDLEIESVTAYDHGINPRRL